MNPKGEGCVYFDKQKKKWIAKVPVGRAASGNTSFRKQSAGSRREANEVRRVMLSERDNAEFVATRKATFQEFANEHMLYEAANELRQTTWEGSAQTSVDTCFDNSCCHITEIGERQFELNWR
jgi:hypothetical protein